MGCGATGFSRVPRCIFTTTNRVTTKMINVNFKTRVEQAGVTAKTLHPTEIRHLLAASDVIVSSKSNPFQENSQLCCGFQVVGQSRLYFGAIPPHLGNYGLIGSMGGFMHSQSSTTSSPRTSGSNRIIIIIITIIIIILIIIIIIINITIIMSKDGDGDDDGRRWRQWQRLLLLLRLRTPLHPSCSTTQHANSAKTNRTNPRHHNRTHLSINKFNRN